MIQSFTRVNKEKIKKLELVKCYDEKYQILKEVEEGLSIGKSWEFLRYLLTGKKEATSTHILDDLFLPSNSTIEISEEEYEYTYEGDDEERIEEIEKKINMDVSYLKPEELIKILSYLKSISIKELFDSCDFEEVNRINIYPGNWDPSEGTRNYIVSTFEDIYSFIERAIEEDNYVISEIG